METKSARSRVISWDDPSTTLKEAVGRSGLELLREIAERRVSPPPISVTLGFYLVEIGEGRAVFEGDGAEYLYNPIGVVHGGFAMTLLDSAMGCSVHSTLKAGDRYTTLEVKTNFVRPITLETGRVRCEGVIVHRGNTIATAEGKVTALGSGKLLAHGTTTCLITPARSA
jgi:uncharacterized protein (TIGR00369 family)